MCLIVNSRHGEYIFTQKSFYLQGVLDDINEQATSFLECKHKHMMKSGAPPDKVRVLYRLLPIEFHCFTSKIDFGLSHIGSWSYLNFFIDGMGPFKRFVKLWVNVIAVCISSKLKIFAKLL